MMKDVCDELLNYIRRYGLDSFRREIEVFFEHKGVQESEGRLIHNAVGLALSGQCYRSRRSPTVDLARKIAEAQDIRDHWERVDEELNRLLDGGENISECIWIVSRFTL